jgi:hypothetical protein
VDLELYASSFHQKQLHAVLQFLELFQWDRRAERLLDYLLHEKWKVGDVVKAEASRRKYKEQVLWDEPIEFTTIVGVCPKCDWPVVGDAIHERCERKLSGRLFIKECTNCTYYSELFEHDGELTEVEGE